MATAKKNRAKRSTGRKRAAKRGTERPENQLPPIIIKGGSPIDIEYEHSKFKRDGFTDHHKRPSGKPISAKIVEIVVEVPLGTVVGRFPVPSPGNCQVTLSLKPE